MKREIEANGYDLQRVGEESENLTVFFFESEVWENKDDKADYTYEDWVKIGLRGIYGLFDESKYGLIGYMKNDDPVFSSDKAKECYEFKGKDKEVYTEEVLMVEEWIKAFKGWNKKAK